MTTAPIQVAPAASFIAPEGFEDSSYAVDLTANERTIFIARPGADANDCCSYLLDDNQQRLYLPNSCSCYLNHLEIVTVEYENATYGTSDKLLVHFTSIGGDPFVWRVGINSYAASSLLISLCQLNSVALTGQVQVTWVPKAAAVFTRVAAAVNGGFVPVSVPKHLLGTKLTFDESMDAITFINQSVANGDAIPPTFFQSEQASTDVVPVLPVETSTAAVAQA